MKILRTILLTALSVTALSSAGQSRIIIKAKTLMHEMRATPSPLDGDTVADRKVSLQWPMEASLNDADSPLDGYAPRVRVDKSRIAYKVRFSRSPIPADGKGKGITVIDTRWPMYNPDNDFQPGTWYWQYGYVDGNAVRWSAQLRFVVKANPNKFCPPALGALLKNLPQGHPRILTTADSWSSIIAGSMGKEERAWYISAANKLLTTPMKSVDDITTSALKNMKNEQQVKAYLTRESRRVIDKEEGNCNALAGAYVLTRDRRYADEALHRILQIVNWDKSDKVKGDFNDATFLSLATTAYDTFYNILSDDYRATLLSVIRDKAGKMYGQYNNHLENHIADNHVWQMTLRILTMAAFATYGDLPEATTWTDYCYNVWLSRMPGLNDDGAWHNGDSYFTVNTRTLIEVPLLYTRLSGFNFFSDPWYSRNVLYAIYQQPPFSKSGGNGSTHQEKLTPNAGRVSYLDALARILGDTYAADFVRMTLAKNPSYLRKAFLSKSADLTWFRICSDKPLPTGPGLAALPAGHVFPNSGLASFMCDLAHPRRNAWWSFRSSPYGSTSHALANQNAFNTFYGGQSLFYSSGHHTSFIDHHALYCERASRAHNTILANGMGQRIGTEGYGWIPRWYVGEKVGYVLGDASNAYGPVISPLWKERAKLSEVEISPKTGWDTKNHVKTYRRHMVNMGKTGLLFIYDELEADSAITWTYLLHSVLKPLSMDSEKDFVHIEATNDFGASDAYLFAPTKLTTDVTDQFFYPAVNWLKADDKGVFKPNANHWHFSAKSPGSRRYHFATIIDTHALKDKARVPVTINKDKNGRTISAGTWKVSFRLSPEGKGMFHLIDTATGAEILYQGEETIIKENEKTVRLTDQLPKLEI